MSGPPPPRTGDLNEISSTSREPVQHGRGSARRDSPEATRPTSGKQITVPSTRRPVDAIHVSIQLRPATVRYPGVRLTLAEPRHPRMRTAEHSMVRGSVLGKCHIGLGASGCGNPGFVDIRFDGHVWIPLEPWDTNVLASLDPPHPGSSDAKTRSARAPPTRPDRAAARAGRRVARRRPVERGARPKASRYPACLATAAAAAAAASGSR